MITQKNTTIYRPTPEVPSDTFTVVSVGAQKEEEARTLHLPHGSQTWCILHMHSDGALGQSPNNCGGNSTIIWNPTDEQHYGNPTETWTHSWLHARGVGMKELIRSADIPTNTPLQINADGIMAHYASLVYHELSAYATPDMSILRNLIRIWLRELSRLYRLQHDVDHERIPEEFQALRSYIEDHLHERFTLESLAQHTHLSTSQFCLLFKRYYHTSPLHFVNNIRINRASILLGTEHLSIGEIAAIVGFDDALYFSRLFKKTLGISPKQYRVDTYT